jgi:DNA-binding transcriptional LysR family regulator
VSAARGLLEQAQAAARQARDVDQGLAGTLRIGFAGTMLYRGLPQILAAFTPTSAAFGWCCAS